MKNPPAITLHIEHPVLNKYPALIIDFANMIYNAVRKWEQKLNINTGRYGMPSTIIYLFAILFDSDSMQSTH
jgi:hypothetical protein